MGQVAGEKYLERERERERDTYGCEEYRRKRRRILYLGTSRLGAKKLVKTRT